jgi:hypothetical protein
MYKLIITTLILLFLVSCGGNPVGFQDTTPGEIAPELQPYVDAIANYALEYNAQEFHNRMQYIDVVLSNSEKGQALLEGEPMHDAGLTFPRGTERSIVINADTFFLYDKEEERLILVLHEFGHATGDEVSNGQHIEDVVYTVESSDPISEYTQPLTMPLSLMSSNNCLLAAYFWDKYQEFYLRTFFDTRLNRTWR